MIDFHTHLLPGIDDGSRDTGMTEAMLREEKKQGVEIAVATPHFYAERMSLDGFLKRRAEAMERTERIRQETDEGLPEIVPGAEVYYFPGMGSAGGIEKLCIGKTRAILIELPFAQWHDSVLKEVESLISRQRLDVILAHVERYAGLQKDKSIWNQMMRLPLTMQLNAEGFIRRKKTLRERILRQDEMKKFCTEILTRMPRVVLGSDCHNLTDRAPNLGEAFAEITAMLGPEITERIERTAGELLAGTK